MKPNDGTHIVHEEEESANTAGPNSGRHDLNDNGEEQRKPGFSWKLNVAEHYNSRFCEFWCIL